MQAGDERAKMGAVGKRCVLENQIYRVLASRFLGAVANTGRP